MISIGCDYSASECFLAVSDGEKVLHTFKIRLEGDLSQQRHEYFVRVQQIFMSILKNYNINKVLWLEEPWVSGSHFPQAAIKLARNAAYIELAAIECGIDVRHIHISTWRKGIYGHGKPQDPKGTAKAWVLYNLGYETKNHNLAEAACIAVYGIRNG